MTDLLGAAHHASHLELAAALTAAGQRVDALIVDAPYSERTHAGHDDGTAAANRFADWAARQEGEAGVRAHGAAYLRREGTGRRGLDYAAWGAGDVEAFVSAWAPLTNGWLLSLTDHVLAPAWEAALQAVDRYVFAPLACVEMGSRVRMTGDGPSNWSVTLIASRPKTRTFASWGSLPGAYIVKPQVRTGRRDETASVVGGKALDLMRALVRDYSRPGDLVCDPCAGAGTTLVAAKMSGRRFVGCDIDAAHVAIAQRRLDETVPCDARGTPIGGAKGRSESLAWGDDYAAPAARKAGT